MPRCSGGAVLARTCRRDEVSSPPGVVHDVGVAQVCCEVIEAVASHRCSALLRCGRPATTLRLIRHRLCDGSATSRAADPPLTG